MQPGSATPDRVHRARLQRCTPAAELPASKELHLWCRMLDCKPSMLHVHCHNYRQLIRRWRNVARKHRLLMRPFAEASGHPVFSISSRNLPTKGGIYLSAGIHGDEAGATEGLIAWAEEHDLSSLPLLILPCLNPWGLVHNNRLNQTGEDLNRLFQHDKSPVVGALKQLIEPYRFRLSISLHEDYDAMGVYLYEMEGASPFWGEALLEAVHPLIPVEPRRRIDGKSFKAGVMRSKLNLQRFRKLGYPESVHLHRFHSERTFTFETPSEFALEQRVRAHVALLKSAIDKALCKMS